MTTAHVLCIMLGLIIAKQCCCSAFEKSGGEVLRVTKNGFEKCQDIHLKKLHIQGKVCIVISILSSELGLEVNITWNGKSVFHTKISAKQPPAICFKLPIVKGIEACLKLTDVSFKPHHHGACLQLTVKAMAFKKLFKLGCIYKSLEKTGAVLTDGYKTTKETGRLLGGWYEPRSERTAKTNRKTGHQDSEWTEIAEMVEMTKSLGSNSTSTTSSAPTGKCTCQKARKCMCCNTIPKTNIRVCGKAACSKKGKSFWLSLFVNNNKNFKVYCPVERLFTMVCGDPRVRLVATSTCLQLSKVQQSDQQLKGCLTAHVVMKTFHRHIVLGCFTLKHQKICKENNDAEIRFVPPQVHKSDPIYF